MRVRLLFRLISLVSLLTFAAICNAAPIQTVSSNASTGLDISLDSASGGYTLYPGTAPVWGNLQAGGYVEFSLEVSVPGTYSLAIYYSTTLTNQSANILVNGTQQAVAQLPSTHSWENAQNSSPVALTLPSGTISLTIAALSSSPAFNIQGLTLVPIQTTGSVQIVSSSTPTGLNIGLTTASNNYTFYSGSPSLWGNLQTGGYLEYALSSTQEQNTLLAINYSTTQSGMSANILVNGAQSGVELLGSTGMWSVFEYSAPVSLTLPSGTSTLRIASNGANPAFNIKGITLTPVVVGGGGPQKYPLAGQKFYVNPYTVSAQNLNACASIYPSTPNLMSKIATQPQSVWFGDWNTDVQSDAANLAAAAAAQQAMPSIVVYNIPDRDCAGGYSSGGVDDAAYRTWVQNLAIGLGRLKVAVILEPDALSQIDVCNMTSQQEQDRYALLQYAVSMFNTYTPNASVYIDAGHSDDSIAASDMAQRLQNAGVASGAGFSLNTSYYGTTASNVSYGQSISALLSNQHFIIDTGRNGNGPTSDAQWCNPSNRALGTPPEGFTTGLVDGYLWVKNPGESDGTCNGGPQAGQFFPQMACDLAHNAAW